MRENPTPCDAMAALLFVRRGRRQWFAHGNERNSSGGISGLRPQKTSG